LCICGTALYPPSTCLIRANKVSLERSKINLTSPSGDRLRLPSFKTLTKRGTAGIRVNWDRLSTYIGLTLAERGTLCHYCHIFTFVVGLEQCKNMGRQPNYEPFIVPVAAIPVIIRPSWFSN
jgi:hypothetical protein